MRQFLSRNPYWNARKSIFGGIFRVTVRQHTSPVPPHVSGWTPPIHPPSSTLNHPTVPHSPTYTASSPPNSSPVFLRYPLLAPSVISPFLGIFSPSIFPINFFTSWTATPDTPISSVRPNLRQLHCILANNAPDRWHLCIPNKLLS